jgi:hypothetical protein
MIRALGEPRRISIIVSRPSFFGRTMSTTTMSKDCWRQARVPSSPLRDELRPRSRPASGSE